MMNGPPDRRAPSTSFSACLSACRSDPQIPQASVLTSASPGPGSGEAMSATTSFLLRITVARMRCASGLLPMLIGTPPLTGPARGAAPLVGDSPGIAGSGADSAVHHQRVAGDERRIVGGQEQYASRDLAR